MDVACLLIGVLINEKILPIYDITKHASILYMSITTGRLYLWKRFLEVKM